MSTPSQDEKPRYARVGAALLAFAALLLLGLWSLIQDGDGLAAVAGVLLAAGAGLAAMIALATSHRPGIPQSAKYLVWLVGVLLGIVLFKRVGAVAAGMVGAIVGLLPFWPRVEAWIRGADT